MEPHAGKPGYSQSATSFATADDFFLAAKMYAERHHAVTLQRYRTLQFSDIGLDDFWEEYIWTVCTSGFNAKVVTSFYEDYLRAIGSPDSTQSDQVTEQLALPVYGHRAKLRGILKCRKLILRLGWDEFRKRYLLEVDAMTALPYVGRITKYHLARNLGIDGVKPDLHLVRLATYYGFHSPWELCSYLVGRYGERLGVVDFILWAWSAAFGTKDIEGARAKQCRDCDGDGPRVACG